MDTRVKELAEAAEQALRVMPEHRDCRGKDYCQTGNDDDRCCAGEVTRLERAVKSVDQQSLSRGHCFHIDEEQRQATLLALAHLAVRRPGWDSMLREIAGKMDTPDLVAYEGFKTTSKLSLPKGPREAHKDA